MKNEILFCGLGSLASSPFLSLHNCRLSGYFHHTYEWGFFFTVACEASLLSELGKRGAVYMQE